MTAARAERSTFHPDRAAPLHAIRHFSPFPPSFRTPAVLDPSAPSRTYPSSPHPPPKMDRVYKEERNYILGLVKKIRASGCNVLLVQKSILRDAVTDLSLHYLVGGLWGGCYS